MRKGRIFLYLALILVLGFVVVFVFMRQFLNPTPPPTEGVPTPTVFVDMVDVVITTQRVNRGQVLDETVLGVVPYQRDLFIEGMFTDIGEVVGRRAKLDLEPGFVLTGNMIAETAATLSATGSDAALMIPRGMVAVSVPVSRLSSVSYAPQRGDHVNVIVTMLFVDLDSDFQSALPNLVSEVLGPIATEEKVDIAAQVLTGIGPVGRSDIDLTFESPFYITPSEPQRPRLVSQTLIQDVIVLQMGDFDEDQPDIAVSDTTEASAEATMVPAVNPDEEAIPVEPPPPPDLVTLIVTPQDAVTMNYLLFSGAKLTLALRGAGDDSRIQSEAVTLQYLLDQYNIPVPVKLPYGTEPRIGTMEAPVLPNDTPEPTPVP